MERYRLYIDESGNSDLNSSINPNHRFLSLTGVILDWRYAREVVHKELEELKSKFFDSHPDEPLIFHRKDIVKGKKRFSILRDSNIRNQFNSELIKLLVDWQYTVITICIDKKAHLEKYQTWRYDPYHYCLELLVERYVFFLRERDAIGDSMAESRNKKEDLRLKKSYKHLWKNGNNYLNAELFQKFLSSSSLKIKPKSKNVTGLQLADLLTLASRNEILITNSLTDKELSPFNSEIIKILRNKYYKKQGVIEGYGMKLI